MSELPLSFRSELIAEAENYTGIQYEWGGQSFWWEDDPSVDCSGFVINVYKTVLERHGHQLLFDDTTAYELWDEYTLPVEEPLAGDLIFFTGTYDAGVPVSHVGIYVGNNRFIHCGDPISYASVTEPYWASHLYGYGRIS